MEQHEEQYEEKRKHLTRLAEELAKHGFTAERCGGIMHPCIRVTNPDPPQLTERVLCGQIKGESWSYLWPWMQPIGRVDDVESAAAKIMTVLRSVEGES